MSDEVKQDTPAAVETKVEEPAAETTAAPAAAAAAPAPAAEAEAEAAAAAAPAAEAKPAAAAAPAAPKLTGEELAAAVRKQVEFYFCDSNLVGDAFMRKQVTGHAEGHVDLSVIASFKRMQNLTTDLEALAAALRASETLSVTENGNFVFRKTPFVQEEAEKTTEQARNRSVYAKGFTKDPEPTFDAVTAVFAPYGKVNCVRLRRVFGKNLFKGSVFVEMESEEAQQAVLAKKGELKFADTVLELKTRKEYEAEKLAERDERIAKKKAAQEATLKAQEDDLKAKLDNYTRGVITKFSSVGPETNREDLKEIIGKWGKVNFAEFNRGDEGGFLRFESPEAAAAAIKGVEENKPEFDGKVIEMSMLEGDEEKEYWAKVIAIQMSNSRGTKRNNSGGRGGRGGGRGRHPGFGGSHHNNKRRRNN